MRIDSEKASTDVVEDGTHPSWQTEFAHTCGEPPAGSVAAAFLRFLAGRIGQDILRTNGSPSCAQTPNPLAREPT
ncbi:hypothetical protein [Streptomyces chromofuscus]|uniref:Uncharacterized protein n=1 Tax=Streptomyces chromofuscus TaxID=42881 RepID=A0A7M2TH88_STRCW|nr:hypothetical protein [Streptomyces chromofuscus]QOV47313.1 hypothetical protein IPT68_16410 [Streptomyces chromofuscus]GGT25012.1 hypothetical protein GCM10010254_51860 [Streptomyces chromofuscus]